MGSMARVAENMQKLARALPMRRSAALLQVVLGAMRHPRVLVEEVVGLVDEANQDVRHRLGRASFEIGPKWLPNRIIVLQRAL